MFTESNYHIVSNNNGRRILVVTELFIVQEQKDICYEDFDAIFIDMSTPVNDVIRHVYWKISPIFQSKCWLKPIFVHRIMENKLHTVQYLIDGYASTPQEITMTETIEKIYTQIAKLGFNLSPSPIKSSYNLFTRLCLYSLSRGNYTFTSGVIPGIVGGYTQLYTALFPSERKFYIEDRNLFNNNLLEKGYIHVKRFVEKIHLCPKCNHSHLLFLETCPKCKSSDIKAESVIHHFRCANISPESTYVFGDELRCPKCKKFLRHIGVDYDRPSEVYLCNNCQHTFFSPKMQVVCMGCGERTTPSELKTFDSVEYEFTEEGIRALISNTTRLSTNKGLQIGYVDFEQFIGSIMAMARNIEEMAQRTIFISRTFIDDTTENSIDKMIFYEEGMHRMMNAFRYSQLSLNNKYFYQMYMPEIEFKASIEKLVSSRLKTVMEHLYNKYNHSFNYKIETYSYSNGDSLNEFIEKIRN